MPPPQTAAVSAAVIAMTVAIAFAFGVGGPLATFAGLLHMTVHSLVKSAIFFAVGHAAQKAGTQVMQDIRGLVRVNPPVGWGLMLGSLAILGMPPFCLLDR